MPPTAGHDIRLSYLWEDDGSGDPDFMTASPDDSDNKPFGSDARLTTREGSNNAVRTFDPNSREAREIIEQEFEGSWSVEFTLTNPWWVKGVIADASSSGTDPTTHTYDGAVPFPMRLIEGNESTGNEYELKGCVIASCTVQVSVGGTVDVTLDGAYADEEQVVTDDVASLTAQPTVEYRPLHFAQATVERPTGTTLSLVQNVNMSIENNTDLLRGLGSRFATAYSPKARTTDVSYGDIVEDDSEMKRMYGDSAASSPEDKVDNETSISLVVDNGETGSAKNSLQFDLTKNITDTYSRSGAGDVESDLEGELSEMTASVSATADNDTATAR